jgi:acyl dehydratase
MAVERFPIEAGHVMMFARSIGDPNPVYSDAEHAAASGVGGLIAPPTFVQASAQFDPDYGLRPRIGKPWFGSGRYPSGLQRPRDEVAPATEPARDGAAPAGGEDGSETGHEDGGKLAGEVGGKAGGETTPRGGGGSGLHAEQHYTYHRPVRVGDVLTATTTPGKRWEKQGRRAGVLVFAETVTEYRDQQGELVVTARSVAVRTERAVSTDAPGQAG